MFSDHAYEHHGYSSNLPAKAHRRAVAAFLRDTRDGRTITGKEPLWLLVSAKNHYHCPNGLKDSFMVVLSMHPSKFEADGVTPKAWRHE